MQPKFVWTYFQKILNHLSSSILHLKKIHFSPKCQGGGDPHYFTVNRKLFEHRLVMFLCFALVKWVSLFPVICIKFPRKLSEKKPNLENSVIYKQVLPNGPLCVSGPCTLTPSHRQDYKEADFTPLTFYCELL